MSREKVRPDGHLTPREQQALAHCDCPGGMSTADLMAAMDVRFQTAHEFLSTLAALRRATRVKAPGAKEKRFFARPAHAAAWLEIHVSAAEAAEAKAGAERAERAEKAQARAQARAAQSKPKKPVVAPAAIQRGVDGNTVMPKRHAGDARAAGAATNPNGVEPVRAATPVDTRFTVAPGEVPPAVFSGCAIGVNPLTGLKWGAVA